MPEGDTVWWACRRLNAAFAGTRLTRCEFRVPKLATSDLTGVAVIEAVSRGKHQLLRFENRLTLHTHLRMQGQWRFARAPDAAGRGRSGARSPSPAHEIRIVLGNERGLAFGMRIPVIDLVRTDQEDRLVGHLGPDLMADDFDAAEAVRRLARLPDRTIGEAVLDQRNLAGIGTFWRAELLFVLGVHPLTPVGRVDLDRLCATAHDMMIVARNGKQTTVAPGPGEARGETTGAARGWVFERAGQPCRRCRTRIAFAEIGEPGRERNAYWCPHCQPAPGWVSPG